MKPTTYVAFLLVGLGTGLVTQHYDLLSFWAGSFVGMAVEGLSRLIRPNRDNHDRTS